MSEVADAPSDVRDRIKLPFSFDVEKMQEDIKSLKFHNFIYYDAVPLRAPAHLVDPSLPMPPPADDYADGSWTDWLDSQSLLDSPYLTEVVNFFKERTTVTLVRLLRLEPGAVVKEHTDPTLGIEIHKSVVRLTVPIVSNPEVEFYLNNETVPMELGECWYLRLTDPHRVVNGGKTERVNMTIDMIPNEWLKSEILNAQQKS